MDVGDVVVMGVGFEPLDEGGRVFVAFEGGAGVVADVVAILFDGLVEGDVEGGLAVVAVAGGGEDGDFVALGG